MLWRKEYTAFDVGRFSMVPGQIGVRLCSPDSVVVHGSMGTRFTSLERAHYKSGGAGARPCASGFCFLVGAIARLAKERCGAGSERRRLESETEKEEPVWGRKELEMEKRKDAPVPEGEELKSDAEIVEEVLKTEVKQSTFLGNVGLQSSRYNSGKATPAVTAHVRDLEPKLERSELQAEVMQEEMAREGARDKELGLLRKKSLEQEEKLAHLMALFGAKAS
ncbi:hypothetical protein D1007_02536 [Hordeum vulgare]|nr:hypothetical protein D1007_02536 [Hordeum vulgare]